MTINQFVRSFGMFGILGFVVTVVAVIINIATNAESLVGNYLTILGLIFVMFGVVAAYLSQSDALGVFGFISLVVMLIGNVWTIGSTEINLFTFPVINDLQPSMNIGEIANIHLPSPIKESMITSFILSGVGSALFGLAILFKGNLMRWPGLLLIITAVATALEFSNQYFSFIGVILSLIAVLWMSIKVVKRGKVG